MSLTCGPLKITILTSSGHPKSIKVEVVFDAHLIDFEDDGASSAQESMLFLSEGLLQFPNDLQQFCCIAAGGYQQV